MIETSPNKQSGPRFDFAGLWAIFLQPRQVFTEMASETRSHGGLP